MPDPTPSGPADPRRLAEAALAPAASPLMLCDRLLTLAKEADRAGLAGSARRLLLLARGVLDEKPPRLAA